MFTIPPYCKPAASVMELFDLECGFEGVCSLKVPLDGASEMLFGESFARF